MFNEDFKLHADEKVILYGRRHWLFFLIDIVEVSAYFLGVAVFVWGIEYLGLLESVNLFGISFSAMLNILLYMWGVFCWLLLAEKVTDYAIDFWIVTNKRIVDSELERLFYRRLATLELKDIEDISIKTSGFISSYLAYGNLEVQTAGAQNRFQMEQIGHPEIVQRVIFEAKLAQDKEEKDIEKQEIEQISQRVFKEENQEKVEEEKTEAESNEDVVDEHDFHIPHDQKNTTTKVIEQNNNSEDFDWAHSTQTEEEDYSEIEDEYIDDKYKDNIDRALLNDNN
jgi:hypothetical protein